MKLVTKICEGCFLEMSRVPLVIWYPLIGPSRSDNLLGFIKYVFSIYVLQLRLELLGLKICLSQVPLWYHYMVEISQELFLSDDFRL